MGYTEEEKEKMADSEEFKELQRIKEKLAEAGGAMNLMALDEKEFRLLVGWAITEALYSIEKLTQDYSEFKAAIFSGPSEDKYVPEEEKSENPKLKVVDINEKPKTDDRSDVPKDENLDFVEPKKPSA